MTILAILSVAFFTVHIRSAGIFVDITEQERLSTETWVALKRMTREARSATAITSPAPGLSGDSFSFRRANNSFESCVSCQDRSLAITYRYDPNSKSILRESAAGTYVMADNVESFNVLASADSAERRIVTITLTRAGDSNPGNNRITLTTTTGFYGARNSLWREVAP